MKLKKKAAVARRIRRMHSLQFKARVALETLRESKTMTELCQEYDLHAKQIIDWKRQLLEGASSGFGQAAPKAADTSALEAKIGRLTMANDFLEPVLCVRPLNFCASCQPHPQ